jgi:hypothetical protein
MTFSLFFSLSIRLITKKRKKKSDFFLFFSRIKSFSSSDFPILFHR